MATLTCPIARSTSIANWRWPWPPGWLLCSGLPLWPAADAQGQSQSQPRWQLWHSDHDTGTQVWLRARGEQVPPFLASTRLSTRLSAPRCGMPPCAP